MAPESPDAQVLEALVAGPATAGELAKRFGIDMAAVYRRLEKLVVEGNLKPEFRREGMGRPKKYYQLTHEGRERLPRRYEELLELIAEAAQTKTRAAGLGDLLATAADQQVKIARRDAPRKAPLRERIRQAVAHLEKLGFVVELEERDGKMILIRRDCVFLRFARNHHDALCDRFDTNFISKVTGKRVPLATCLTWGEDACRHEIPLSGA